MMTRIWIWNGSWSDTVIMFTSAQEKPRAHLRRAEGVRSSDRGGVSVDRSTSEAEANSQMDYYKLLRVVRSPHKENPPLSPFFKGGMSPSLAKRGRGDFWVE